MADILAFKKPKPSQKHKGKTLCKHNFHKWVEDKKMGFDVKKGKLVTRYRCTRCGATRVKST
jgi:hypothetical protein